MKDTRTIHQLLHEDWRIGMTALENDSVSAAILVTFDHDFTHHVVTKEWTRTANGTFEFTGHALYYMGFLDENEITVMVQAWDTTRIYPEVILESAKIVAEWLSLVSSSPLP